MNLENRRLKDRLFGGFIRLFSLTPILLVVLMVLTLADQSMGTVALEGEQVIAQWPLTKSLLAPGQIRSEAAGLAPDIRLAFRFWLSPRFLTSLISSDYRSSGFLTGIVGSFRILLGGFLLSFPIALLTAMWSSASREGTIQYRILGTVLGLYRRIPHVLYGICGLALFSLIHQFYPAVGIRRLGNASILMGFILLPRLTVMMRREMDRISPGLAYASFALGASPPTVAFRQILPASITMIMAQSLRIISGVLGLASPFIVLGAAGYLSAPPMAPADRFTTMSVEIYRWSLRPDGAFRNLAAAGALFLLIVILLLNLASYFWRKRILRIREGLR